MLSPAGPFTDALIDRAFSPMLPRQDLSLILSHQDLFADAVTAWAARIRCRTSLCSLSRSCRSRRPPALGSRTHCRIFPCSHCRSCRSRWPAGPLPFLAGCPQPPGPALPGRPWPRHGHAAPTLPGPPQHCPDLGRAHPALASSVRLWHHSPSGLACPGRPRRHSPSGLAYPGRP